MTATERSTTTEYGSSVRNALTRALVVSTAAYLMTRIVALYFVFGGTKRHHVEAASFIFLAAVIVSIVSRRRQPHGSFKEGSFRPGYWLPLFLGGALALYAAVVRIGLFADDYVLLNAVREGRWTAWGEFWRPFTLLVWRIPDGLGFSGVAAWLHGANIALHGVNACAVAVLARRLQLPQPACWLAGSLFLVFPASVEAVVWPSGMQDLLMTALVFAYVIVLLTATARDGLLAAGALAAFVAALCTKETAVAAPFLATIVVFGAPQRSRYAWQVIGASVLVIVVYLIFRSAILELPTNYFEPLSRYLVKEMLVRPFATLAVPFGQTELSLHPWIGLASASVVVVLLSNAACRWGWLDADFSVCLRMTGFALGSVAPVYTYLYIQPDLHGSRYVYLASGGWAILLSTLIKAFVPHHQIMRTAVALAIVSMWTVGVRAHVSAWYLAAAQRDQMLAAAESIVRASDCDSVSAEELPPLAFGVPLWVNGFPEAMRMRLGSHPPAISVKQRTESCRLIWSGDRFTFHK